MDAGEKPASDFLQTLAEGIEPLARISILLAFWRIEMNNNNSALNLRVNANIQALASLTSPLPCLETLKNYSGWGGLKEAIYTPEVYRQLKRILSDDDITAIKNTLKTAYYTPKPLVEFIYQMVIKLGCKPNSILEPSCGHGAFIESMPESLRQQAKIIAVEMDFVSCRLIQALYPDVSTHYIGFEQFNPDQKYGLIVGNPPFGQFCIEDTMHPDLSAYSIHHYFVGKCMRLLEEGGILAMVVPRYFLDSRKKHIRGIIEADGGSLIAAFRLPDDLFENAKVTVDVVFLRKSPGKTHWLTALPYEHQHKRAFMNQYFFNNPTHVIGKIEYIDVYDRTEITCKRIHDDVYATLQKEMSSLSQSSLSFGPQKCQQILEERLNLLQQKIKASIREYRHLKSLKQQIDQCEQHLINLCQTFFEYKFD